MKKHKTPPMDERQQQINIKAVAAGAAFLMLCMFVAMICDLIRYETLGWEFWGLMGTCIVIVAAKRIMGDVEAPTDIHGQPLPTGNLLADKQARRKDYALRSLMYAGICTVLSVLLLYCGTDSEDVQIIMVLLPGLPKWIATGLAAAVCFVLSFGISYGVDWLIGEKYTVKRYRAMEAALDEEE